MAKATVSLREGIKDITECSICSDTFSNPRMLPCIHTFCYSCLEKTKQQFSWEVGEKIPCPLCRREFTLPVDGIKGIPKNFFTVKLIEMTKTSTTTDRKEWCDQCSENETLEDSSVATEYCIECQDKLCESCANYHKRQKKLNHQIVDIRSENIKALRQCAATFCRLHKNKPVEMFCNDCNEAICVVCFAVTHRSHEFSELKNAAEIFREELSGYIDTSLMSVEDGKRMKDKLEEANADFMADIERIENDINKTANEMKELIEKHREALLNQLNCIKQKIHKCQAMQTDELNSQLAQLESFKAYCTEMEAKGSNGDLCSSINYLRLRSNELKTIHESLRKEPTSSTAIAFKKSAIAKGLTEYRNCIRTIQDSNFVTNDDEGSIKVKEKHAILPNGEFSASVFLKDDEFDTDHKCVASATIELLNVHNKQYQYIIYKDSNTILSIPRNDLSNPYKVHEEFVIEQLEVARDMALCTISNSLYVTDSGNNSVWKIDLKEHQVRRWLNGISEPYTLSVCNDGRVVIPRDEHPSIIEVYGPDAILMQTIQLSDEIHHLFRAIETQSETFVIIHHWVHSKIPRLSQMNGNGELTHIYGPMHENAAIGEQWGIFRGPWEDKEVIFAIDFNDYRNSLVLDSNLTAADNFKRFCSNIFDDDDDEPPSSDIFRLSSSKQNSNCDIM